jgi:hypothetical protein
VGWDWFHLVLRPLFGLLYQHRMIDDECGVVGGMRIERGNRSTRRKHAAVQLCTPRIPNDLIRARILAAAAGSRRLTAWATTRPVVVYFKTPTNIHEGQKWKTMKTSVTKGGRGENPESLKTGELTATAWSPVNMTPYGPSHHYLRIHSYGSKSSKLVLIKR